MKMTLTIGRYMAQSYFVNLLFMLGMLLGIIYLFDTVELIRRASKASDVSFSLVLQMGLLKLPEVGQILFPFAVLFSAMFTFWQFNRRSELVVLRSSGFSVWQFLAPVLLVALAFGALQVTVINPVGAMFVAKYEQIEQDVLGHEGSEIALFKEGLWLRQSADGSVVDDVKDLDKGYIIMHARSVSQPDWALNGVTVFYFGEEDTFLLRVDSESARLEPGRWFFDHARLYKRDGSIVEDKNIYLPTRLTYSDIEESFSSPQSMSFWQLPSHIQTLEETGFDASRLHVFYHNLLSQPLFFMAMVLLAATVSMRPPRFKGAFFLFAGGVFIGFFVFFMSSYLQALGASQQIPPILAAWAPAIICSLLGLTVIMNLEDG